MGVSVSVSKCGCEYDEIVSACVYNTRTTYASD